MLGQSIIELLIAVSLTSILLPALFSGVITSREGKAQQNQRIEASTLLKEAEEVVRIVREKGWSTFAVNGTFYPQVSGDSWLLVSGSEQINGFSRSIEIGDVYRNSDGIIIDSGGSLDFSSKRIIITVSWDRPFPTSVNSTVYLTRYLNNSSYTETTEADFDSGTKDHVVVTNTYGGELMLGTGGGTGGNWCEPSLSFTAVDLPKQGVANGITAIEGRAFAGTGNNASGESYANISISNENPPIATIEGTFSFYKTNSVFGENDYGYIATDTNQKEILILDINSNPYTEIGYFDSPGPTDANSIFVDGNVGYMTAGNILYSFDLSTKISSRPPLDLDGLALSGIGTKVVVKGNYAYVAISDSSVKMQVVDVSNPANLSSIGQVSINSQNSQDVFINPSETRAYLVTSQSATQDEFFIIDISSKTGSFPIVGSYDTNGMSPKGVVVVPGNRSIVVGTGGEEYQVLDITNETNPVQCGGMDIDSGINGIASVLESDGDAFSYIITGDANSEFNIIAGGAGGEYTTTGEFESTIFDPGFEVAFNKFYVNFAQPINTDIKFQLAIADPIDGNCDSAIFTFVGSDGTSESFFTDIQKIPFDDDGLDFENPGRCYKYKIFFSTSDILSTSVLYDISVNYSP